MRRSGASRRSCAARPTSTTDPRHSSPRNAPKAATSLMARSHRNERRDASCRASRRKGIVEAGSRCAQKRGKASMVPRTRTRTSFPFLVLAAGVLAFAHAAKAQEACEPVVAQVVSFQGHIEIQRAGTTSWMRVVRLDTRLCQGDRLRSGARSRAALLVSGQALLRVDQGTTLGLRTSPDEVRVEFDSGAVYSISRFPRRYRIITPFVNAGVEGTEFLVTLGRDQAEIAVYEGRVAAEDRVGEPGAGQVLQSGQAARFARGAAPAVRALVNPTDAVQWALYYPPLDSE